MSPLNPIQNRPEIVIGRHGGQGIAFDDPQHGQRLAPGLPGGRCDGFGVANRAECVGRCPTARLASDRHPIRTGRRPARPSQRLARSARGYGGGVGDPFGHSKRRAKELARRMAQEAGLRSPAIDGLVDELGCSHRRRNDDQPGAATIAGQACTTSASVARASSMWPSSVDIRARSNKFAESDR